MLIKHIFPRSQVSVELFPPFSFFFFVFFFESHQLAGLAFEYDKDNTHRSASNGHIYLSMFLFVSACFCFVARKREMLNSPDRACLFCIRNQNSGRPIFFRRWITKKYFFAPLWKIEKIHTTAAHFTASCTDELCRIDFSLFVPINLC